MALKIIIDGQEINNAVSKEYSVILNELNKAEINIDGSSGFNRSKMTIGSNVEIYRNNVLEFHGEIKSRGNFEGNAIKLVCTGEEEVYARIDCEPSNLGTNGVYQNTGSSTILTDLINEGTFTVGTIDTGLNIDEKFSDSLSLWNGIGKVNKQTAQEISIDYSTTGSTLNILDRIGNVNVTTLNEGADFKDLQFFESEASAKKVIVYGKGDGNTQVKGTATSTGYVIGDRTKKITDPTLISDNACTKRAEQELAKSENNQKNYEVYISNPYKDFNLGDSFTINAPSYGITDEVVRIVRITRGSKGDKEYFTIEVTNEENSRIFKNAQQRITELGTEQRNKDSVMQGSGNTLTFGGQINGTSNAPLIVPITISDDNVRDEAGNIRVTSFTLDYDIDKYRKSVGDASPSGTDADVGGSSSDTEPPVENSTALTQIDVDHNYNQRNRTSGDDNLSMSVPFVSGDSDWNIINMYLLVQKDFVNNGFRISLRNVSLGLIYFDASSICLAGVDSSGVGYAMFSTSIIVQGDIEGDTLRMYVYDTDNDGEDYGYGFSVTSAEEHNHSAGSLNAQNHPHFSGTYDVSDNDIANAINIGESLSDATSVSATGVSWELDYWNGTSWVTKNTGSETFPTGQTFNFGVDVSNSLTYPDATGNWRLVLYTNSTTPDLIKALVNIKHNLENK